MREIKFRAWDKDKKCMVPILYPITDFNRIGKQFEVMQYTGLKDKNGVEIYEGDIVEIHGQFGEPDKKFTHVIHWNEKELCFDMKVGKKVCCGFPTDRELEVIGNIYEHPHLLSADESKEGAE